MECIQGKRFLQIEPSVLDDWIGHYQKLLVDIGTGDGRFVRAFARAHPEYFAVGLDTCRENLQANTRLRIPNMIYLIGPAKALPTELYGRATILTINFPWGSLLRELLDGDPALLSGLSSTAHEGALLEIRVNADALLHKMGSSVEQWSQKIQDALTHHGFGIRSSEWLGPDELGTLESTWAKRLAFGRDRRALYIVAERIGKL